MGSKQVIEFECDICKLKENIAGPNTTWTKVYKKSKNGFDNGSEYDICPDCSKQISIYRVPQV